MRRFLGVFSNWIFVVAFLGGFFQVSAQVKNDALCLSGGREIDLSNQMPPTKDQGKRGVCYVFAAAASLEAARVRNTGKAPRPISESFLLGAFLLDNDNKEIDIRVKQIEVLKTNSTATPAPAPAQPVVFKKSYSDAGYFHEIMETAIKYRRIPAAPSTALDFQRLERVDRELTMEALEKGENFNMPDLRPFGRELVRDSRRSAHDADLDSDFNFRTLQMKQAVFWNAKHSLRNSWYTDLFNWKRSFNVILDVARWYKEKTGEDLAYESISQMAPAQFDSFLNQASRKLAIAQAKEARQTPSIKVVDPNYERFAAVLTDLYYAPKNAAESQEKVKGYFTSRFFSKKSPPLNPLSKGDLDREFQEFNSDCYSSSEEARKAVISSLCAGIPVTVGITDVMGTQMETVQRPQPVWKEAPPAGGHAVVITGIEEVNGEPYYIMRNSSYAIQRLRMPVALSCRIMAAGIVLGPRDPGYMVKKESFLDEMQNARDRHE